MEHRWEDNGRLERQLRKHEIWSEQSAGILKLAGSTGMSFQSTDPNRSDPGAAAAPSLLQEAHTVLPPSLICRPKKSRMQHPNLHRICSNFSPCISKCFQLTTILRHFRIFVFRNRSSDLNRKLTPVLKFRILQIQSASIEVPKSILVAADVYASTDRIEYADADRTALAVSSDKKLIPRRQNPLGQHILTSNAHRHWQIESDSHLQAKPVPNLQLTNAAPKTQFARKHIRHQNLTSGASITKTLFLLHYRHNTSTSFSRPLNPSPTHSSLPFLSFRLYYFYSPNHLCDSHCIAVPTGVAEISITHLSSVKAMLSKHAQLALSYAARSKCHPNLYARQNSCKIPNLTPVILFLNLSKNKNKSITANSQFVSKLDNYRCHHRDPICYNSSERSKN